MGSGTKAQRILKPLSVFCTACGLPHIRWCTISVEEMAKCNDMNSAFAEANILPRLSCVRGGSASNCTYLIKVSAKMFHPWPAPWKAGSREKSFAQVTKETAVH